MEPRILFISDKCTVKECEHFIIVIDQHGDVHRFSKGSIVMSEKQERDSWNGPLHKN